MTVSRFHVRAMDCTAEEQLVRMRLADLPAVRQVSVDLSARQVTVVHDLPTAAIDAALQSLDLGATHLDDGGKIDPADEPGRERGALMFALLTNAGFFVGEMTVGLISRSMGLVADALDMGADASVYALSLLAVGKATSRKKDLARLSGCLQLGLAGVGLAEVIRRVAADEGLPNTTSMIVVSLLALIGNLATLLVLHRIKTGDVHIQASWIFTANDLKVNALVIAAAVGVMATDSAIPDLLAGALIFGVVANGARRILRLSR